MLWLIPSITALLIKCVLLFYKEVRTQYYLIFLLLAFFALNLLELIGFFILDHTLSWLKLYYCIAIFTVFYTLLVCCAVADFLHIINTRLINSVLTFFAAIIFFTDKIVLDAISMANGSITRITGDYYFIFQLYILPTLTLALLALISRIIKNNNYYLKARCIIALLSFVPTILTTFLIMLLMQLGYKVNMAGFLSLSSCFMLLIFIPLSNKRKLFHTMKFVPFSRERRYHLKVQKLLKQLTGPISGQTIDIKKLLKELEALTIQHTHCYFATQKEVAHMLRLSESSLSRKVDTKKTE